MATTIGISHQSAHRAMELYGPARNRKAAQIKQTLQRSHIFQDGEYNYTSNKLKDDVWMTTVTRDYLSTRPDQEYMKNVGKVNQIDHHFRLGNDGTEAIPVEIYQISATKGDFDGKQHARVKILECDRVVNWPDMAPQFRKDVQTGDTEYKSSIAIVNEQLRGPMFPRLNTSKMLLPLDQGKHGASRRTNVSLGNDHEGLISESRRAYGQPSSTSEWAVQDHLAGRTNEAMAKSREMRNNNYNSHIFRDGDYNGIAGNFLTTNTGDYGPRTKPATEVKRTFTFSTPSANNPQNTDKEGSVDDVSASSSEEDLPNKLTTYARDVTVPLVFNDAKAGRTYQHNAHFQLGFDNDKLDSIYSKDFATVQSALYKPPTFKVTPSANNVMQFDPDHSAVGTTSSKVDFSYQPALPSKMATFGKFNDLNDNVHLSYDLGRHTGDRQTSLAHASYVEPPSSFKALEPQRAPRIKWDYLQTDDALPYTGCDKELSEAKNNFFGDFMFGESASERRRVRDQQCKERFYEGTTSHFELGNSQPEHLTETQLKYAGWQKNDKDVPPAGKIETIAESKFAHTKMSENTQDMLANDVYKPSMGEALTRWNSYKRDNRERAFHLSVMKSDFKPLPDRRFTQPQTVQIEQCSKMNDNQWSLSHLFHTDNTGNDNFVSTTMSDFLQPITVSGQKRLTAL